jgi:hypothetical protein
LFDAGQAEEGVRVEQQACQIDFNKH